MQMLWKHSSIKMAFPIAIFTNRINLTTHIQLARSSMSLVFLLSVLPSYMPCLWRESVLYILADIKLGRLHKKFKNIKRSH